MKKGAEGQDDRKQSGQARRVSSPTAEAAAFRNGIALTTCFLAHQNERERNEHLTIMNWRRTAAAKRLLRDILIAVKVWLNIMNHFHRIRAFSGKRVCKRVCKLLHTQFILMLETVFSG